MPAIFKFLVSFLKFKEGTHIKQEVVKQSPDAMTSVD